MVRRLKNIFDVLATVLLVIASSLFIWTQVESRWLRVPPKPQVQDVADLSIKASAIRNVNGTGSAALVEFTDFECPFCGEFARQTAPAAKQFVASGTLRHVVLNSPLEQIHPHARRAAEAAECAARQGRYWEMHARLFSDRINLDSNGLMQSGKALGLDETTFAHCLSGEATDLITADIAEARRLGVRATPTLFLGKVQSDGSIVLMKRIGGAVSIDDLKRIVEMVFPTKRA